MGHLLQARHRTDAADVAKEAEREIKIARDAGMDLCLTLHRGVGAAALHEAADVVELELGLAGGVEV
ncbi:hypothetical protein [Methylobacterium isbiliense]|uniref:hypothetical protein n=1 Tax=Methylobacterium isbiliense TaxID=315478 RepID=UPI001EE2A75F|nr:hypothetical protein [Methylobacterium isbiliense]MDN3627529.1 hypothetical protein [Methylobacterium isbiliense]